jgi:diadenylate cyclase
VGALIVLEQKADLRPFEKGSIPLDAALDRNLLFLLFVPAFENPTHDGAVLVRGNRIVAAHCILPLAQVVATDRAFGTRHRAALGLAEQTDALVIVVSEETGRISVAWNGHLERGLAPDRLREILITASAQQQAGESVPWRPPVAAPATPAAPAAPAPTQHSSQGKPTP